MEVRYRITGDVFNMEKLHIAPNIRQLLEMEKFDIIQDIFSMQSQIWQFLAFSSQVSQRQHSYTVNMNLDTALLEAFFDVTYSIISDVFQLKLSLALFRTFT